MLAIQELLAPDIGSPMWQWWWTLWNVFLHMVCIGSVLACFYVLFVHRKGNGGAKHNLQPPQKKGKQRILWIATIGCTILSYAILPYLYYFKRFYDATSPFNGLRDLLHNLLNPVLAVDTILDQPFNNLPSLNIGFRLSVVFIFVAVVVLVFRFTIGAFACFGEYLDTKFIIIKGNQGSSQKSVFAKTVDAVLTVIIATGSGAILANIEEIQDTLTSVWSWIELILKKIVENFDFPTNPATTEEILRGLLIALFVICVAAFLIMLIVALVAFVYHVVELFPNILRTIKENMAQIGKFVLKLIALMLAFALLILLFLERGAIVSWIGRLISGSPRAFLLCMQQILLLALGVSIGLLLLFFVGILAEFCYSLLNEWAKEDLNEWLQGDKRKKAVFIMLAIAAILLVIAVLVIFTGKAFSWLISIGSIQTDGVYKGLKKLLILMPVLAIVVLFGVFAISLLGAAIVAVITACKEQKLRNGIQKYTNKVLKTVKRILSILGNLLDTIIRIFQGYRTESEKNSAVYVAATFASLASLLNTFFGLYNFNRSDESVVPVITSLAIAFAVQLAMLIFGMKAGQGLAENIVFETRVLGTNTNRVIVKKLFGCGVYLLLYVTAFAAIKAVFLEQKLGFASITLPNFLFWISTLLFGYAMIMEGLDFWFICRSRKSRKNQNSGRDAAAQGESDTTAFGVTRGRTKRIPVRYFLIAYMLLMIVSSGFAFNNLFGCYANATRLHNQVNDQVRYETDAIVSEELTNLVTRYHGNDAELERVISDRIEDAKKKSKENIAAQQVQADAEEKDRNAGDTSLWSANNALVYYQAQMADLDVFCEALSSMLAVHYDALGDEVQIDVFSYDHYRKDNVRPEYTTVAVKIQYNGQTMVIGREIDCTNAISVSGIPDGTRYADPDRSVQNVTKKHRVLLNQNKYGVIRELLNVFETMEAAINNFQVVIYETTDNNYDFSKRKVPNKEDTSELLKEQEMLDGIRLSVANLCNKGKALVPMVDLHRVIYEHLSPYGSVSDDTLTTKALKEKNFQNLELYVNDSLQIYNLLHSATMLISDSADDQTSGGNQTSAPIILLAGTQSGTENNEDSQALQISQYLSYARGVNNSDFTLSYDVLFAGGFGLNNTGDDNGINALYSSRAVAVFILIICLLVDFMAFFAGLLLFQDAFLLDISNHDKAARLGAINIDAVMTNFFMPTDEDGDVQKRQLALIHYVLYRMGTGEDDQLLDKFDVDKELLKRMIQKAEKFLREYGLDRDSAELHFWLKSFVDKHHIDFKGVLKK